VKIGIVAPVFSDQITSADQGLAEGLGQRGHDVTIITTARRSSREIGTVSRAAPAMRRPFRVVRLRSIPAPYAEGSLPLGLGAVLSAKFDGLLLQEDYPPISLFAGRLARRVGTPFFVTFERYNYYGKPAVAVAYRFQDRTFNRFLWRNARGLTFHCRASASFLVSIGAPSHRLYYTPSPVDCGHFSPSPEARMGPGGGPPRILCAARLVPAKGLGVLLDAVKLLSADGISFSLLIRGRGPLAGWLEERIHTLHLESVARIDQSVNPAFLPDVYRNADIYVQPSVQEPYGIAVREAMACGLPIVVTRCGGLAEAVAPGETGFLVSPYDPRGLADALARLIRDGELRRGFGRAGRAKALRELDIQVVAARYERILLDRTTEEDALVDPARSR
jgi:glycosyltransferase involved in cell wall biosynthesis